MAISLAPASKATRPDARRARMTAAPSRAAAGSRRRTAAVAAAAKGVSLHIGLNLVDPKAYSGWDGRLNACEFDAHDMETLAKNQGFSTNRLITKDATRGALRDALAKVRGQLAPGDLFFLTYSGHGGQMPDTSNDEPDDGYDETWCLFDGQLLDDEIYLELSRFPEGVRIFVLSDSCHSGTVTRALPAGPAPSGALPRLLPPAVARRVYLDHKDFYDELQANTSRSVAEAAAAAKAAAKRHFPRLSLRRAAIAGDCKAAVILISGCQDNQTSMDGQHNGAFTERVLQVWNEGRFDGSIRSFHSNIVRKMPSSQTPNLFLLGPSATVASFAKQRPFTV